jgi:Ni,Fe-hydrogenase I cytochrome b subunit
MVKQRILVWDLPTRLFHWFLALRFAGAYVNADSERWRDVHVKLGYLVLGLLVFRLSWCFMASRYARFFRIRAWALRDTGVSFRFDCQAPNPLFRPQPARRHRDTAVDRIGARQ